MKQELQEQLFKKYPKIFIQKDLSIEESCMAWGITCGDGWYNLIDTLCSQIEHHLECYNNRETRSAEKEGKLIPLEVIFEASQVKEKFGGLRYSGVADDATRGFITMAEAMSFHICDICGNQGKLGTSSNSSWLSTRCGKHRETHWHIDKDKSLGSVAIDFDGVINSYKSGFVAIDDIPDPPVEGAFEFIDKLLEAGFKVYIF